MTFSRPAPESTSATADERRWGLLHKKTQEAKVLQAFNFFRQAGIEPVLIKGLAAAVYYPASVPRLSIDIDLAVSSNDEKAALNIIKSGRSEGLAIDLHRELRHLDTVPWADLFDHTQMLKIGEDAVRVLCPEDHLRVLCVHWLTDGGASKSRLWDIYYLVENRPDTFDWDRFLNVVNERRRRWLVCTLGLARRYLDLDLAGTPVEDGSLDLPVWLTNTVEREWAAETRQIPLETTLRDPKMLFTQIRKRMRPNPIWATVQMNGSFDARTRVHYQIGNLFKRIVPSFFRIRDTLRTGG